jgi:two-component system phosphate regulon response regulator OmpR
MPTDYFEESRMAAEDLELGAITGATFSLYSAAPHVLHVDGDQDAALVLATLLVPETHVTHVQTLAEAVQAIEQRQFALVVLDPDLPDGDGAMLIDVLRQAHAGTPVLLYSARQPEHRNLASAFLPKPWTSPRQLWRTISELLGIGPMATVEPQS